MRVELVYAPGCPHVGAAREALLRAFARAGRPPHWIEWASGAPGIPEHARDLASPTVLIDGRDAEGPGVGSDLACRIYATASGRLGGAPDVARLAARLRAGASTSTSEGPGRFAALVAAVPAGGALLLPVGACPACWPAYATVLGSIGLGFLIAERVLLPLAAALLLLTLGRLASRARLHRRLGPLLVGLAGAGGLATARLAGAWDLLLWGGAILVVTSALWDARLPRSAAPCPSCVPASQLKEEPS